MKKKPIKSDVYHPADATYSEVKPVKLGELYGLPQNNKEKDLSLYTCPDDRELLVRGNTVLMFRKEALYPTTPKDSVLNTLLFSAKFYKDYIITTLKEIGAKLWRKKNKSR